MRKLLIITALFTSIAVHAQKKPLDHSVYDSWQSVTAPQVSANGTYVAYQVTPQEGDGKLIIHPRKGSDIVIERGAQLRITPDEQWAVCIIKPLFKDTRQAKIKKWKEDKMPKDTLALIRLATGSVTKIAAVTSFKMGNKANATVAWLTSDTTFIPKKERTNKDVGRPLFIRQLATGDTDTLHHVSSYQWDKYGRRLAYLTKEKKDSMTVGLFDAGLRKEKVLGCKDRFYSLPSFDEDGSQMLWLVSNDTLSSGSKHCEMYYMRTDNGNSERLISMNDLKNLPKGWGLNENSSPYFSHNGQRIFAGVAKYMAPKDTTLVPFETAGLDIWNWNAPEIPPMMRSNLQTDLKQTHLAVFDKNRHQLIPLSTSKYDRIRTVDRGDASYAISTDATETVVETQWNTNNVQKVSLVDLATGSRKQIFEGVVNRVTPSPGGKYVAWYDMNRQQWFVYDVADGSVRDVTSTAGVNFWDEEDDHPMLKSPYGLAGWSQGDDYLFIYDRYDIWKVPAKGGKPVCLTAGDGRKNNYTYRYLNTKHDDGARYIEPKETMLLTIFDKTTKMNGYATVNASKVAAPRQLALGGWTYDKLMKAEKAPVYAYLKGNFENPMDIYTTNVLGGKEQKLSAINPQQKDYNWGTAELYHWTAYDGTKLDGILYKPEDFDETKKYPVMIYFYEKRSESLYSYVTPQPSWSTVNLAFYTSRGYVVFVPDIVYPLDGLPGEAAYNCICSGAESLTKYPWIDKDNMAIQGQSWGGYQVAYLITRTNMFKAAGAGAPVSNMTSAYGGIRWESGMSRQFQYEQTQSRVGKTLWDGLDLYLKNSCLFSLPNVQTPVLIMHNDADGAVPWYQGIEMFMGLRRLQKPAWMLQYNNEAHNLKERRNRKDLTIRLQQFFDHYLKGAPEPAWMKYGVPATRKGQYFGLENASEYEE